MINQDRIMTELKAKEKVGADRPSNSRAFSTISSYSPIVEYSQQLSTSLSL